MLGEIRKIAMPRHHEVTISDVNLKRLGAVLTVAHEMQHKNFESIAFVGRCRAPDNSVADIGE